MTLASNPLYFIEGMPFSSSYVLAGLTDAAGDSNPSDFTVWINFGDGSAPVQASLSWNGSGFNVTAPGHTYGQVGTYDVTFSVSDVAGDQATFQQIATVGDAPMVPLSDGLAPTANAGQLFSGTLGLFNDANAASTAANFTAVINWGDGAPNSSATISPFSNGGGGASFEVNGSHTYATAGNYAYTLTIQDSGGGSLTELGSFVVTNGGLGGGGGGLGGGGGGAPPTGGPVPSWNSPTFQWTAPAAPSITAIGTHNNAEGDAVSLQVQATDPNPGPPIMTYDAVGLPGGLTISHSTGLISGTVGYGAAEAFGGVYNPTVIVGDSDGASASTTFTWNVAPTLRSPVISPVPNQTSEAGDTVSVQVNASQPDGYQIEYDDSGLPPGLTIDSFSGVISGTIDPSAAQSAPYVSTITATVTNATSSQTASTTFDWTVNPGTQPPVLTSPGDQTNAVGDGVSLSLSATDANGDPLTCTAASLPAGLSLDPGSGTISGTLSNSSASTSPYTVIVSASNGSTSASQTIQWTVSGVSVQNPGDQSNLDGDTVSLPIAATDVNNQTLTYSATGLPPGLTIGASSGVIAGPIASTADANGPYAVTVTATDGTYSQSQSFNWNVARLALAAPDNQSGVEGGAVSLPLTATDNLGAPTYSAVGLPAGLSINSSTGRISVTLGIGDYLNSPYQVTATATDGSSSESQSFVWTVTPRVGLTNPGPQANAAGDAVSLPLSAADLAGANLTYSATGLPAGLSVSASTGVISGAIAAGAANASPYSVTVTASDGTSSSSQTFLWSVGVVSIPQPGTQTNLDGDAVSLSAAAHYHGAGTLGYSATGLPIGLGINASSGLISGTVYNTADADGPYDTTVTATDGTFSGSVSFTWNINSDVSLDPISDQTNGVGDVVSLPVLAGDQSNGTLSYSATGLPAGLAISGATGVISGTIAQGADVGSPYVVTVTAADATSSASETFNWTVTHISLANPGPQSGADDQVVSLPLQGHDAYGGTLTFGATGLPPGLSISSGAGVISGTISATADQGGPYTVTATATDGTHTTSQTFLWTATAVGVTSPGDQTSTEGDTISLPITAATGSGPLTYSAGGLPDGLSINPTTGVISGVIDPGDAESSPYSVTVAASNGAAAFSQAFTWNINSMVTLTAPADQTNAEGDTVSLPVSASDPAGTLSYSADGLPPGLSISSATGLISGTVAAGDAVNSPYSVDVTATDGTYSTDQVFTWTVTGADETTPTLTNPGNQANVAGDTVSLPINAADADGAMLMFSATGLPDGLNIDPDLGIISGTIADDAIQSTPYVVTVTAADGNGLSASQTFDWFVNDSTMTVQANAISQQEGAGDQQFTVASFTDPDLNRQSTDYTATISWGDSQTSQGWVDGSNGSYTVTGDHVYLQPGSFPVSVAVTDPAGGTATGTATAAVSVAPLTASGGFVDGAIAGTPATLVVATFSEGNTYDAASSFTATINWGDNSAPTAATVDGLDGVFRVLGSHTYAQDGYYTAMATIFAPDGQSATATSSVQVGDIQAGTLNTLTVASFTDSDPNAQASNFKAWIDWGDGSTGIGTVSEYNGLFSVTGSHVYTAPGAYGIEVAVTDLYGHAIYTGTAVQVAPAKAIGNDGVLESTVGVPLAGNAPLAVLAGAIADGAAQASYAVVNWGDGVISTVTLGVNGDLYDVPADHTYQTAGTFGVQTLFYNAANLLIAATVSFVDAAAPPQVDGPAVVPGNSQYIYTFNVRMDVNQITKWNAKDSTVGSGWFALELQEAGKVVGFDVFADFANEPAKGDLRLKYWVTGEQDPRQVDFTVTVVQVDVKDPVDDPAFNHKSTPRLVGPASSDFGPDKDRAAIIIDTSDGENQGIEAYANVVLKGPNGNEGVNDISVGFIQHGTFTVQVTYQNPKETLTPHYDGKEMSTYINLLDKLDPKDPTAWAQHNLIAVFSSATPKNTQAELHFNDSPSRTAPLTYNQAPDTVLNLNTWPDLDLIKTITFKASFILDVAAVTKQSGGGASDDYFAEARAPWTVDASGTVTLKLNPDTPKKSTFIYKPDHNPAVKSPDSWSTLVVKSATLENTSGPILNDVIRGATFS
ncbi:MAG TPA: putative Ig domain-containing protein [Gemmataceae bacterium]|nr:putative Ig domain-containing protein [Gemmataceae bacterium]